jgi:cell division protein ZapA (FtsZ GTPase activity inhibitor)
LYKIIDYYREKTLEVCRTAPSADSLKAAILAGIIVADELFKLKENPSQPPAVAEEVALIAERLIRQLAGAVPQDEAPEDGEI